MDIFTVKGMLDKRFYLTPKNIQSYLSEFPYHDGEKIFAICPYCHNPIQIVLATRTNQGKATGRYYAKHIKQNLDGFPAVNDSKYHHCLLRKKSKLFVKQALFQDLDLKSINYLRLQKALSYLLGFYISIPFTKYLTNYNKRILYLKGIDQYNIPFAILINAPEITLKGRKIANRLLAKNINEYSKSFFVNSNHQVNYLEDSSKELNVRFARQGIDKNGLNYITAEVVEKDGNAVNIIFSYRIFVKMFNVLFVVRKDN